MTTDVTVEVWRDVDIALMPGEPAWIWQTRDGDGRIGSGRASDRDTAVSDALADLLTARYGRADDCAGDRAANSGRAARGLAMLAAYVTLTGRGSAVHLDERELYVDLVSDLLHAATSDGHDPDDIDRAAWHHFTSEVGRGYSGGGRAGLDVVHVNGRPGLVVDDGA
jgi:hypothetical protein